MRLFFNFFLKENKFINKTKQIKSQKYSLIYNGYEDQVEVTGS